MTRTRGGAQEAASEPVREPQTLTIALVGNPNSGKTTLFNALTGLRQKVGNYPGVTVERKEGTISLPSSDDPAAPRNARVVDLPGLYSLTPHSPDEKIARDALLGYLPDLPRPQAIVNVVDASNLERNLFLTSQLLDLGVPLAIVLTMGDTAEKQGTFVDADALGSALGIPVRVVTDADKSGVQNLPELFARLPQLPAPERRWWPPQEIAAAVEAVALLLRQEHHLPEDTAFAEAVLLLAQESGRLYDEQAGRWSLAVRDMLTAERAKLTSAKTDVSRLVAESRYSAIARHVDKSERRETRNIVSVTEWIDRAALHPVWGYVIFAFLMFAVFQAMFTIAAIPAEWIKNGVDALGGWVTHIMPSGDLRELLVQGVLGGVGNSLVFLPQILMLFLFISLLEDTGYLARGAFLVDRIMSRVGLHGKSFIPLLSSYACAIPGVMATRTIESPKARLLTILVAPLMSCSARLPVYALLIGTFVPKTPWGGTLPALTLFSMYALGTTAAFGMAALFNKTMLKSEAPSFLLEMPPYRLPHWKSVLWQMAERAWLFVRRAGTVILTITVLLWFLASYPKLPGTPTKGNQLRHSFAGRIGRALEPTIRPLGFDWKIGIGLLSSFAAREVFVSAMGTVYNLSDDTKLADDEEKMTVALGDKLKTDKDERTGKNSFTPLTAVALMVYYVLAMQCMSTVAVVRRETGGWRWPLFQIAYMTALAWIVTFIVYQGGRALGFG